MWREPPLQPGVSRSRRSVWAFFNGLLSQFAQRTIGAIPCIIELKSSRELTRLVSQVNSYAAVIECQADSFEKLFSTLLGKSISLQRNIEKYIVWPQGFSESTRDVLQKEKITAIGYTQAFKFVREIGPA